MEGYVAEGILCRGTANMVASGALNDAVEVIRQGGYNEFWEGNNCWDREDDDLIGGLVRLQALSMMVYLSKSHCH